MPVRVAKLKKLRDKSLDEIRERGKQELVKLGELLRPSREMSDRELLGEIRTSARNGSSDGSSQVVAQRIRRSLVAGSSEHQHFFTAVRCRDQVVSIIDRRFPDHRAEIIDRADRAIEGRFDLLGFKDLSFGKTIDWRLEPVSGKRAPFSHWSRIDY